MKLLLDQGLPRSAAKTLREQGKDCFHVGEIGMSMAKDTEIMERAVAEGRVIVTLDGDFHFWLAHTRATAPSVIHVRIEGVRAEACLVIIREVWSQYSDALEAGCVVSVLPRKKRMHKLPI